MTRINVVHPEQLCDAHLLAEWKEIFRVFNQELDPRASTQYILGTGHVKFARAHLRWIYRRIKLLVEEMEHRGFNITLNWKQICNENLDKILESKDYQPTDLDGALNGTRINQRLETMKNIKWTNRPKPRWVIV